MTNQTKDPQELAFLKDIAADPEIIRVGIYADWLEESADPARQAYGAWLRQEITEINRLDWLEGEIRSDGGFSGASRRLAKAAKGHWLLPSIQIFRLPQWRMRLAPDYVREADRAVDVSEENDPYIILGLYAGIPRVMLFETGDLYRWRRRSAIVFGTAANLTTLRAVYVKGCCDNEHVDHRYVDTGESAIRRYTTRALKAVLDELHKHAPHVELVDITFLDCGQIGKAIAKHPLAGKVVQVPGEEIVLGETVNLNDQTADVQLIPWRRKTEWEIDQESDMEWSDESQD